MESTLFVPKKTTFSECLRCLNFLQWILCPAITKQGEESNLLWDSAPTSSAEFKHLKFYKIVNFEWTNSVHEWTNSVHSILDIFGPCITWAFSNLIQVHCRNHWRNELFKNKGSNLHVHLWMNLSHTKFTIYTCTIEPIDFYT